MQNIAPDTAINTLMIRPLILAALSLVNVLTKFFILSPSPRGCALSECKDINILYLVNGSSILFF